LFNPDRNHPVPCEHLVASCGGLDVARHVGNDDYKTVKDRCLDWLWLRGPGNISADWHHCPKSELSNYLLDVVLNELFDPSFVPPKPYFVVGGTALEREERRPGSGEFALTSPDRDCLTAILDGWGIYAYDAGRFIGYLADFLRRRDNALRSPETD
jgi:hypothetical protein